MNLRRITCAVAGALAIATAAPTAAAVAETSSPGTFAGEFKLPQRWNDDFKPGTFCATPNQNGTYPTAERRWFKQTDATSVANHDNQTVPVKHTVKDVRTQTLETSGKAAGEGDLAKLLTNTYGFTYVHITHWGLNQIVGPYDLPAGRQGRLVWGFTVLDTTNQNVKCGMDKVWHPVGAPFNASVPEGRYSELRLDDAPDYN